MKILIAMVLLISSGASADETVSLVSGMNVTVCQDGVECYLTVPRTPIQVALVPTTDPHGNSHLEGSTPFEMQLDGYTFETSVTVMKFQSGPPLPNYIVAPAIISVKKDGEEISKGGALGIILTDDLNHLNEIFVGDDAVRVGNLTYVLNLFIGPPGSEAAPSSPRVMPITHGKQTAAFQ